MLGLEQYHSWKIKVRVQFLIKRERGGYNMMKLMEWGVDCAFG